MVTAQVDDTSTRLAVNVDTSVGQDTTNNTDIPCSYSGSNHSEVVRGRLASKVSSGKIIGAEVERLIGRPDPSTKSRCEREGNKGK